MPVRKRPVALALLATAASLVALTAVAVGKPDKKELEQLLADTDAIAQKVSKIRGLPVKTPVARGIMSRDQVEARVMQRISEEYSDTKLAGEERAAKKFGFLPEGADYKKVILALLTEQIAGFYDPAAKELYLADWIDVTTQRIVMAHEICHALQDQSFDLQKFTSAVKDDGDAALARQALVEGDGVALMIEFMFQEMGVKVDPWVDDTVANAMATQTTGVVGMESFAKAPLFLRESLMFPYLSGLKLVATTRRHHPWSRVDDMFKMPPASTEQVMHPEKYFAGEKPVKVKAAAALPSLKKWKIVEQNVLGEAAFGWLWRQHGVRDQRANDAAAGWGGDRYAIYAPPTDDGKAIEPLVLVTYSVWDTETDAEEAFAVAVEALPVWTGARAPAEKGPDFVRFEHASGAQSWVARKGAKLVIVIGQPAAAKKLRQEIWARWR